MVDLAEKHTPLARMAAKVVLVLVALAAIGWGGREAYFHYMPRVLAARAESSLSKGDIQNAALLGRRAYQIRGNDIYVQRAMADICDRANNPAAMEWRSLIVQREPQSKADVLAYARTALKWDQPKKALDALVTLNAGNGDAEVLEMLATVRAALGNYPAAEQNARQALQIDPNNPDYRLTLAAIQLKSGRLELRSSARATLEQLRGVTRLRTQADRLLRQDAISNQELNAALKIAMAITQEPNAEFADKVAALSLMHQTGEANYREYLESLKKEASGNEEDVAQLSEWLRTNDMVSEVCQWADTLPDKIRFGGIAGPSIGLSYIADGRWNVLRSPLPKASWGGREFMRLALLAYVDWRSGMGSDFLSNGGKAIESAAKDAAASRTLAELFISWNWPGNAEPAMWNVAKASSDTPDKEWALGWLYHYYAGEKKLWGLYQTTEQLAALMPKDDAVQNNEVMFSLLSKTDMLDTIAKAKTLYGRHPGNRTFASTYAFSLLLDGKKNEAADVIRAMTEEDRASKTVAPYAVIILAACGDNIGARKYLDDVDEGTLLPEEQTMVAQAKEKLR